MLETSYFTTSFFFIIRLCMQRIIEALKLNEKSWIGTYCWSFRTKKRECIVNGHTLLFYQICHDNSSRPWHSSIAMYKYTSTSLKSFINEVNSTVKPTQYWEFWQIQKLLGLIFEQVWKHIFNTSSHIQNVSDTILSKCVKVMRYILWPCEKEIEKFLIPTPRIDYLCKTIIITKCCTSWC